MNNIATVLTLLMIFGACFACVSTKSSTSGTITYHRTPGFHGVVIPQANSSTTETLTREEINHLKLVNNRRYKTKVELKVERGNVRLELLDDKGLPTTSVVSTPGKPALVRGDLVVDASGIVKYRIIATEAENIEYSFTIDY
jgi:hypothetical protein